MVCDKTQTNNVIKIKKNEAHVKTYKNVQYMKNKNIQAYSLKNIGKIYKQLTSK